MQAGKRTARRPDGAARTAYNLFRRTRDPEVHCAVPEDRVVPAFVSAEGWSFAGRTGAGEPVPPGFDWNAADVGVRFNGFHLFHA